MPIQLDASRSDFIDRIIEPARLALGATPLHEWLDQKAEAVALAGRRRAHIELGPPVRAALQIKDVGHIEYAAFKEKRGKAWTGSINLSDSARGYAVARVGRRDIRALEAHELGHVLLCSDQRMWKILRNNSLLVDPAIERLTDDAARAILLPGSLLSQLVDLASVGHLLNERPIKIWEQLPRISAAAIVPDRMVASRLAQLLVQREAALLCYSVPITEQPDLFSAKAPAGRGFENRAIATVRWIMDYCWFGTREKPREYLFADRIGTNRRVTLRGSDRTEACKTSPGAMEPELLRKIAGEGNWTWLHRFHSFTRVAATDRAGARYTFVLAEPESDTRLGADGPK